MDPNSADANEARSRLNAEKVRVEALLSTLEQEFIEEGGISLSGDAGADTTYADSNFGLREGLRHELEEVDAALQRVDDGTYGIDEETGDPINPARLEAEPTARINVRT